MINVREKKRLRFRITDSLFQAFTVVWGKARKLPERLEEAKLPNKCEINSKENNTTIKYARLKLFTKI